MDSRTKIFVCLMAAVILAVALTLLTRGRQGFGPAPFPMELADKLSVDQLADRAGEAGTLMLPTWMPGGIELREIYFKGLAILVYSDRDVRDYRKGNVTIQITRTDSSPTYEQLQQRSQRPSRHVTMVRDFPVVVLEDAVPDSDMKKRGIWPMMTYFWHDGFYYIITVNKEDTTREDLMNIVDNMKPVGPETLRKPTDTVAG